MSVLSGLEPSSVFHFFEEICSIPHGSGNTDRMSDYLVNFAKERNLEYHQDKLKNVIIIKEATEGYENVEPILLQGHMDMVAVSNEDTDIDMTKDGLRLAVDGDYVYAEGTSLGGDDGIAVAYALAILDGDKISHPRLEVILTVEEEVGMDGAREIDLSMCKAKRMLNIDSEEEGVLLTSCAGGATLEAGIPFERRVHEGNDYYLAVTGLQGGHSGAEIHLERGNANIILARVLHRVARKVSLHIYEIRGGQKENAIPNKAEASFIMKEKYHEDFMKEFESIKEELCNELKVREPGFQLILKKGEIDSQNCIVHEDITKVLELALTLPCGIMGMSASVEGLVETSLNLGILRCVEDKIFLRYAVRSSVASQRDYLLGKMVILCRTYGAKYDIRGVYPGWEYKVDSKLREKMQSIYKRMYGKEMEVQAIHAGLECGFFADKIPDLDCVSLGPDMMGVHTTKEKLSISSVKRVWEYLLAVLEEK